MTNDEAIAVMNGDLKNEFKHLNFYLRSASLIQGLFRVSIKPWLKEQAESEFGHVLAFSEKIVALGGIPIVPNMTLPEDHYTDSGNILGGCLRNPKAILEFARDMEQEVVDNYAKRIVDMPTLGTPQGAYLGLFYEEQLEHSHEDLDEINEMLKDFD